MSQVTNYLQLGNTKNVGFYYSGSMTVILKPS